MKIKISKKILSLFLSVIIIFSITIPSFALQFSPDKSILYNGIPTITTEQFIKIVKVFRAIKNAFNGNIFTGDDGTFDVEMDETMTEMLQDMGTRCPFDPYELLTNLPDITKPADVAITMFSIDTAKFRDKMYQQAQECTDNKKKDIYHLIGAYYSGIENAYLYLENTHDTEYKIKVEVTYSDGGKETFTPGIFIDTETQKVYGPDQKGMGKIGFDSDMKNLVVTAPMYGWMRKYGFCIEYDFLCYLLPVYNYNTRRFKFDYQDKEWMIQVWKGNYCITTGSEVGIYNRDKSKSGSYYDCITDEEMMPMCMTLYHGNDIIIKCDKQQHWWINGFYLGYRMYPPQTLTLTFDITLKDEEMVKAFCDSIDNNIHRDVTYSVDDVDGLTVSVVWASYYDD